MACACSRSNTHSDLLTVGHYTTVMPTGLRRQPYKKLLLTSNGSIFMGKSRSFHVDLAIGWSIRQGLGLTFSRKDLTFGQKVVNNGFQQKTAQKNFTRLLNPVQLQRIEDLINQRYLGKKSSTFCLQAFFFVFFLFFFCFFGFFFSFVVCFFLSRL